MMKKQLSEATLSRSTAEEELHGAEAALTAEGKQLAADEKYLAELKQSCSAKVGGCRGAGRDGSLSRVVQGRVHGAVVQLCVVSACW